MNKGLIFSAIMDYIRYNDIKIIDDFPIKLTNDLCKNIKENGNVPDQNQVKRIVNGIKTNFFKRNRNITKSQFIRGIIEVIPTIESLDIEKTDDDVISILFLASNPKDTCPLRLGEEMRAIDQAIRLGDLRDKIHIEQQWAVRLSELQEHFLRYNPNIIHFSGHGSEESEIILEDEFGESVSVPTAALSQLFNIFKDNIQIVLLNACYSEEQAKSIVAHIPFVIGMVDTVSDKAAIIFSAAFYQALGFGQSVDTAFQLALNQLQLESIPESDIPVLLVK